MIIKLVQPPTRNWLLIADQLDDPETWSRFVPAHTADSQRYRFDTTAREAANETVKLKPCKDLFVRGRSVFEYDWMTDEVEILAHAMNVADAIGLELIIGDATEIAALNVA